MKLGKAILILAALSTLTSCSPYLYKDEVTNILSATSSIGSAWKNGQQALTDDYQQTVLENASWHGLPAVLSGPCVRIPDALADSYVGETKNGHLVLAGQDKPCKVDAAQGVLASPAAIDTDANLKRFNDAIGALLVYSAALTALTNATDKDGLTKAATSFNTAVSQMADVAGKAGASAGDVAAAKAAATLLTDVIGVVLDTRRYAYLKHYVLAIDQIMPTFSHEIGAALRLIPTARRPVLAQRITLEVLHYDTAAGKLSSAESLSMLMTIQTQATSFNGLDPAKAEALADGLTKTHHALADALRTDKGQVTALFDAAKALANDAEQIDKALTTSTPAATSSKTATKSGK